MKLSHKKALLATALTATLGFASTNAAAFPEFTVDETNLTASSQSNIVADRITGSYEEVARFGPGTFATNLIWTATAYNNTNVGPAAIPSGLNALSNGYQLYALFDGTGTFAPAVGGGFDFDFNPGDTITMYLDTGNDTTFNNSSAAILSASDYVAGGNATDLILGTGTLYQGGGSLQGNCQSQIDCGSFGTDNFWQLTNDGENFFTQPVPFFDLAFASGNFNNFDPTSPEVQEITGLLNVVFNTVPEPSSLALLGAGLIGFGLSRKKAKA